MIKTILLAAIVVMALSACSEHVGGEPIVNGSCTEERKSSIPCGQKETAVSSDIQLIKRCLSNECEKLNVSKPVFILNDGESPRSLLALGCREDLVDIEDGSWDLIVKGMKYPHPISFVPAESTSNVTCGMFNIDQNEAMSICNFLGRNRIGELGCARACDETTYEFCSTEDPTSIELKGSKTLPAYPSIKLRE